MPEILLDIALPTPLRRRFDYLPPADMSATEANQLAAGVLVRVPFGHQEMTGVLIQTKTHTDQQLEKLRPALAIVDKEVKLNNFPLCLFSVSQDLLVFRTSPM
jgi:primosomal protein N' (replication factor Y)